MRGFKGGLAGQRGDPHHGSAAYALLHGGEGGEGGRTRLCRVKGERVWK
jgi:hypothetical protein